MCDEILELIEKAESGDIEAQYELGNIYQYGYDVEKDYKEALKWYEKSASQNHPDSNYKLGYFYENGYGVDKDLEKALSYYEEILDVFAWDRGKYGKLANEKIKQLSKQLGVECKAKDDFDNPFPWLASEYN